MSSSNAGKRKRRSEEKGNPNSDVDAARSGLVSLNGLSYLLSPDLSVAVSRKHVTSFAQQNSYSPGQKISLILNSGAQYIDPQNSFLKLTVNNITDVSGEFGLGSAVNLFRRVVLSSRSGDEIERVDRVNKLQVILDRYTKDKSWMATVGSAAGYAPTGSGGITAENYNAILPSTSTDGSNTRTYCIPLGCLSSLFRSYDKLLPAHLMSGMRWELELESAQVAFKATGGTLNYVVSDVELHMDAYTLTDSVTRVLNETAATSGLEIPFVTYSHIQDSVSEGSNNFEIRKAVSRALTIITKLSANENFAGQDAKDSMASIEHNIESIQTRVGSLYFPNNPVSGSSPDRTLTETYLHTLHAFGKLKAHSAPNSVSLDEFKNKLTAFCTTLERSSSLNLTGVPVNASRVCEVRMKVGQASNTTDAIPASDQVCDSWLSYVRLIRCFINNVEVEE